jgi:hypothetical protein
MSTAQALVRTLRQALPPAFTIALFLLVAAYLRASGLQAFAIVEATAFCGLVVYRSCPRMPLAAKAGVLGLATGIALFLFAFGMRSGTSFADAVFILSLTATAAVLAHWLARDLTLRLAKPSARRRSGARPHIPEPSNEHSLPRTPMADLAEVPAPNLDASVTTKSGERRTRALLEGVVQWGTLAAAAPIVAWAFVAHWEFPSTFSPLRQFGEFELMQLVFPLAFGVLIGAGTGASADYGFSPASGFVRSRIFWAGFLVAGALGAAIEPGFTFGPNMPLLVSLLVAAGVLAFASIDMLVGRNRELSFPAIDAGSTSSHGDGKIAPDPRDLGPEAPQAAHQLEGDGERARSRSSSIVPGGTRQLGGGGKEGGIGPIAMVVAAFVLVPLLLTIAGFLEQFRPAALPTPLDLRGVAGGLFLAVSALVTVATSAAPLVRGSTGGAAGGRVPSAEMRDATSLPAHAPEGSEKSGAGTGKRSLRAASKPSCEGSPLFAEAAGVASARGVRWSGMVALALPLSLALFALVLPLEKNTFVYEGFRKTTVSFGWEFLGPYALAWACGAAALVIGRSRGTPRRAAPALVIATSAAGLYRAFNARAFHIVSGIPIELFKALGSPEASWVRTPLVPWFPAAAALTFAVCATAALLISSSDSGGSERR